MATIKRDPAIWLRRKRRGIEELERLVQGLNGLIDDERREFFVGLGHTVDKNPDGICTGVRPCILSPIETCVYEYTAEDVCLFCGQTNEIKK